MTQPTLTVTVAQVDDTATPTGQTVDVTLSAAQVGDILSHAHQVVAAHRFGLSPSEYIEELSEALGAGGVF